MIMRSGFHFAGNYFFNISRIQLIKVGGGGGGGNCLLQTLWLERTPSSEMMKTGHFITK